MGERRFADGGTIFRAGDPADGVFRVRAGVVRGVWPGREGPVSESRYVAGDVFGEAGVVTGEPRSFTAIAEGEVRAEFLPRHDILSAIAADPTRLAAFIAGLFGPFAPPGAPAGDGDADPPDRRIRLVPDGKRVRAIVGADEVAVRRLPFSVGRTVSGDGAGSYSDVTLALEDTRPFNLSRRHFTIETLDGALVVRDNGSYHGTLVNGMLIGGDGRPSTAPLMTGDNELVAGKLETPFRFRILVE